MANSTLPGEPCPGCSGADLNGDLGTTENYSFAADSSYLTSSDYILVEGYWYAGFNGNGGVAHLGEHADQRDRVGPIELGHEVLGR
jgi:hypothetical protein